MSNVDVLFGSYRLNALNLPNRVVMAPMTRSMSPGGVPTAEVASYYRRRAENGVGLIITEAAGIGGPAALNEPDMPRFHGEAALAGWKKVVDEVHAAGGRIAPQLVHVGHKLSNLTPDWAPSAPYESPSGFSVTGERISQPMSESDVANAIDAFARAASDAERLGFDAIELMGAHGYLINQFFYDHLNLRNDGYGGSTLVERSRFAVEILKAVRTVVTPGFPVILRLSQWKPKDFSTRLAETPKALEQWLTVLVEAGADAFHLSQPKFWQAAFPEIDGELVDERCAFRPVVLGALADEGIAWRTVFAIRHLPAIARNGPAGGTGVRARRARIDVQRPRPPGQFTKIAYVR